MKKAGREEIKTFIKERLAELLNIEPQSIDENAFLVEDLGIDQHYDRGSSGCC